MLPRFLVPDLDAGRSDAVLPAGEAHHLTRVLRLAPGTEVVVFDGRGHEYRALITSAARSVVEVRLIEPLVPVSLPAVALTIVQSVLKGDAMDGVVRDCTMIGARVIQPVVSERTAVRTAVLSRAQDRWRRIALASAKQCGRATLPEVRDALPFDEWLTREHDEVRFLLAEPALAGGAVLKVRELVHRPVPEAATLVVGPEGGWTPGERTRAIQGGCVPLTLGRLTLRADAVPLAAAATLLALWDL